MFQNLGKLRVVNLELLLVAFDFYLLLNVKNIDFANVLSQIKSSILHDFQNLNSGMESIHCRNVGLSASNYNDCRNNGSEPLTSYFLLRRLSYQFIEYQLQDLTIPTDLPPIQALAAHL